MNTQRPEWNDANNALVGNGVSMVTLCYLRRFLVYFQADLFDKAQDGEQRSAGVGGRLDCPKWHARQHRRATDRRFCPTISNAQRRAIDGRARYRQRLPPPPGGLLGQKAADPLADLHAFIGVLAMSTHASPPTSGTTACTTPTT